MKRKAQTPDVKSELTHGQAVASEWWPLERILPYPKNARKIPQKAIDKVALSIQQFGWRQPIVVDSKGVIVVGHVRKLAAAQLKLAVAPVHVGRDLTPEQIRAYRLMDNRSHDEATWDMDTLRAELAEMKALNFELGNTGFDMSEINGLLNSEGLTDPDEVPEVPIAAVSKLGDVWLLGHHRLVCGDSTGREPMEQLMKGHRADLVFTDPPYNVDYEGYTDEKLKLEGDKMPAAQFKRFLEATFARVRSNVKDGASLYICHAAMRQREFQDAIEAGGFRMRCQIIWTKNTFAWGHARYKWQHEPIFYCHVAGQKDPWYGDKSQSTVWHENKPSANRLHPTMKPVELMERAITNSSKAGDLLLDPFGGSGSTLIACERKGLRCYVAEMDPRYVDVIIARWEQYTGKFATLEGDGSMFEAVKHGRRLGAQDALKEEAVASRKKKAKKAKA